MWSGIRRQSFRLRRIAEPSPENRAGFFPAAGNFDRRAGENHPENGYGSIISIGDTGANQRAGSRGVD